MHVVAASNKTSPIANLASLFHQDLKLMGMEPEEWGREFIRALSADQRRTLLTELLDLKAAYPGKSGKGLRNAWIRLGAQWCPRAAKVREIIELLVEALV